MDRDFDLDREMGRVWSDPAFTAFIEHFYGAMAELRALLAELGTRSIELDDPAALNERHLRGLPPETRALVSSKLEELGGALLAAAERAEEARADPDSLRAIEVELHEERMGPALSQVVRPLVEELTTTIDLPDEDVARATLRIALDTLFRRPRRGELLRRSLIVSAISAFEVLVADLTAQFFRSHPAALGSEKVLSAQELLVYSTKEDAIGELIERKVDSLLRKGLAGWEKWFSRHLGLTLGDLSLDWPRTQEIFQRRNLIVHRGSQVDEKYLVAVDATIRDSNKLGAELLTPLPYIERSLDHLLVFGMMLAGSTWRCLKPHETSMVAGLFGFKIELLMEEERWNVVKPLTRYAKQITDGEKQEIHRVNHWLALKKLGEFGPERDEVQQWDVTSLRPAFALAKLALLDRREEAEQMMQSLLKTGAMSASEVKSWPLLEGLKTHPA